MHQTFHELYNSAHFRKMSDEMGCLNKSLEKYKKKKAKKNLMSKQVPARVVAFGGVPDKRRKMKNLYNRGSVVRLSTLFRSLCD